jgi:3-oxoacyl-[acyl-carrier protein] reductase
VTGPGGSLAGRVALVTGGGRGIGPALCEGLAREGAAVAVNYRHSREGAEETCRVIQDSGGVAQAYPADISSVPEILAMFDAVARDMGPVEVLVNNASVYPRVTWDRMTESDWNAVFDTNVKGMFFCSQRAAVSMSDRRWGRIINLSSVTYYLGGGGGGAYAHYVASKGAVIGLTRALSRELGGSGITVNAIAPGAIVTPGEAEEFPDSEALLRWLIERQAVPRRLVPEDLDRALVYLASPTASAVTGQTLLVDGGWAMS